MNQVKHINLVRQLAWSFCKSTRTDWKELFSEACLAYCEALRSYDPTRGAETTWIYHCVRGALLTFCEKETRNKFPEGIHDWFTNTSAPPEVELVPVQMMVSPDTKDILDMVASNPRRYQCAPKLAIGYIRQDLRGLYRISKKRQWSWPEIDNAVRNLKLEILPQNQRL